MTSEVVLSAALRSNLLSLQRTQSNIDKVQNVLATGLKVASALDGPQSFFASQALKNRAGDLSRLLDGMGQSIQTIKQADQGVTSLGKLIDQAESLATEAQGALANNTGSASITGNKVFKASAEIKATMGIAGAITFAATDKNGDAVTIPGGAATYTITNGDTVEEMMAAINAIRDDEDNAVVTATLDNDGYLQIAAANGGEIRMTFASRAQATGLGFGDISTSEVVNSPSAAPVTTHSVTISSSPVLSSSALYKGAGEIADRSTLLTGIMNDEGTVLVNTGTNANNRFTVGVNGTTYNIGTAADGMTVQSLIDGINNHATLKGLISASFDDATGEIKIAAKTADATTFQIGATSGADNPVTVMNLGFGMAGGVTAPGADNVSYENIAFGKGAGQLAQLQKDFNDIRTQIDELVKDSGYRGVNLLTGDTLTTYFNEDRSSSMAVNGRRLDTSEAGLNIGEGLFSSAQAVADSLSAVRNAKSMVRDFGSLLSNGLSVIQTREDFTRATIQNLEAGSDKLTLADQNEEGAKLLALQTRQQLGVTALSLAAQAQQSVLRLF